MLCLCREDPAAAEQVELMMTDMRALLDDYKLLRAAQRGASGVPPSGMSLPSAMADNVAFLLCFGVVNDSKLYDM